MSLPGVLDRLGQLLQQETQAMQKMNCARLTPEDRCRFQQTIATLQGATDFLSSYGNPTDPRP